ncbi:MAG: type II secretion system protein [Methylophilus sp.]
MRSGNRNKPSGFTLVELLVVLTILALLLSLAVPRYFTSLERAKEATLKHDLNTVREGLDKYFSDNGKYPSSIEELVEQKYINKYPLDPITDSTTTWIILPPDPPFEGDVYDIQSGAPGTALDGTKYSEW